MKNARALILIIAFLGTIFAVPLWQAWSEIQEDESPLFLELFDDGPTEKHLRQFEESLEESSFFEETLRPWFLLARYLVLRDPGTKAMLSTGACPQGQTDWFFYRPGVQYLTEPYYKDIEPFQLEADDPVAVIADFARQLKSRGIDLLVVPVPGKASIYPDCLEKSALADKRLTAHASRLHAELHSQGIDTLNLHPLLQAGRVKADQQNTPLYMRSDTHWTGHGIALAARAMAERVRQIDQIESTQSYRRQLVEVVRRGDIPRMTQIPFQQILFRDETTQAYQVTKEKSAEPYQDDPNSPILFLGDSFARVFQTDSPRAAGIIANLAFELGLPLDSIVNDGGASTLVRQKLAQQTQERLQGKRLVIWAFVERDLRFGMRGWQTIELENQEEKK